ncbi:MAG TPA: hypothetical protein VGE76_21795 [Opitutaceae bacterium]
MKTNLKKSLPLRQIFLGRLKTLLLVLAGAGAAGPAAAQTVTTTDLRAETAYFLAVGQRGAAGPESYVVPVSGAAQIAEVRQYLADRTAGRESRPLIPHIVIRFGSDNINRNHSAAGAPLWSWHVGEVQKFERYTRPEVEPAVIITARDSAPSDIEQLAKNPNALALYSPFYWMRDFPIQMELRSEFPTGPKASLINISDRGLVGTGTDVKITGFVIDGDTPRNVLVRVLGPSLTALGVSNAMANPRFAVYRGSEKIAENDDWAQGPLGRVIAMTMIAPPPPPYSLIPPHEREPALELSLAPGAYTVVVSGVNGATGVVLTEVQTWKD